MKLVLSHPTGNANVRAASNGLAEAKLLSQFHTSIASFPGSLVDQLSWGPLAELRRRQFDPVLKPFIHQWPWRELGRFISVKLNTPRLLQHETGFFSIDAVYQDLDRRVASCLPSARETGCDAMYAYEDGAVQSFRQAKQLGMACLYDLPIGYWRTARKMLEIERERWPDWATTLTGFNDSTEKLARKDEELRLADHIFVASQFTASTLKDYPGTLAQVSIIPYGFPPALSDNRIYVESCQKPLKLLYVGSLSQRKGIANLFSAVAPFGRHVDLTIVGRKTNAICPALDVALAKHRWIPSLPHSKVLDIMREQDVLVFPSLFEGFGLVITEAMSQGTPVITTDRTAGPDLIQHDQNGWLIEAGSTLSLINAIEKVLVNRELITMAGQAARETAKKRPWEVYGLDMAEAIEKLN